MNGVSSTHRWRTLFDAGAFRRKVSEAIPALVFGLRLSASVCLALYVAFWLQLDSAYWAGTSAAIVCQPSLGASLRKGWFRLIGTVLGALIIVALIPLALRGITYRPIGAAALLRRNLLIYGVGGIIAPFVGIKLIDMLVVSIGLV